MKSIGIFVSILSNSRTKEAKTCQQKGQWSEISNPDLVDTVRAKRLFLQPGETAKIGLQKHNNTDGVSSAVSVLRASIPGNIG